MPFDRLADLRTFARIVDAGSLAAAARTLRLSTNAVSRRLMKLEDDLGVRLAHRTTRALALTDEGRALYARAVRVVAELDAAEEELHPTGDPIAGVVRMVIPPAAATPTFLGALRGLLDGHPRLHLQLQIANVGIDQLAHGADLVLHVGAIPQTSIVARRIATVTWWLAATSAYLDRHGRPRRPSDLARHRCLRYLGERPQDAWQLLDRAGRTVVVPVGGTFESDDSRVLGDATYAGLGIGVRPRAEVVAAVAAGRLERVLPAHVFDRIVLHALLPPGRLRVPRVAALLDALRTTLADPAG
ncbi:MAG: LysR family transcriptional regulator [Kofleriaceae bacterium]